MCLLGCLLGVWIRACSSGDGCLWGNCLWMCLWGCLWGVYMHACNSTPGVLDTQILFMPPSVCVQWYVIVCVCVHICVCLQITQYACVRKYAPIPVCVCACVHAETHDVAMKRWGGACLCGPICHPCYKNRPMHTKNKGQTCTSKVLCARSPCEQAWQNLPACTNMPTRRTQAQGTLTHVAGCMLQHMQRLRSMRFRRCGMRFRLQAAPEVTHPSREYKHAGQRGQGTLTTWGPCCCVQCEQHAC